VTKNTTNKDGSHESLVTDTNEVISNYNSKESVRNTKDYTPNEQGYSHSVQVDQQDEIRIQNQNYQYQAAQMKHTRV
jgi:hypothetical protein